MKTGNTHRIAVIIRNGLLILATLVCIFSVCAYGYLRYGHPPVAVGDAPFPYEEQIVKIPLTARIDRQLSTPPFAPTNDDLIAGARIYVQQCATCHGGVNWKSDLATSMYPPPPGLWTKKNTHGTLGVADDTPGSIYWKVDNGIRLTGMPAFNRILNDTQMWQVSLLLKRAGSPLPPAAMDILDQANSPFRNSTDRQ